MFYDQIVIELQDSLKIFKLKAFSVLLQAKPTKFVHGLIKPQQFLSIVNTLIDVNLTEKENLLTTFPFLIHQALQKLIMYKMNDIILHQTNN